MQKIIDYVLNLKGLTGARTQLIKFSVLALVAYQAIATNTQVHSLIPLNAIDANKFSLLMGLLVERGLKFSSEHKA